MWWAAQYGTAEGCVRKGKPLHLGACPCFRGGLSFLPLNSHLLPVDRHRNYWKVSIAPEGWDAWQVSRKEVDAVLAIHHVPVQHLRAS